MTAHLPTYQFGAAAAATAVTEALAQAASLAGSALVDPQHPAMALAPGRRHAGPSPGTKQGPRGDRS